jgi:hypothetical protein
MRAYLLLALPLFGACFAAHDNGDDGFDQVCAAEPTFTIDTGASIDHTAGIDAGYYAEYNGAGIWHFDWTCDTKLSAIGCEFSGTITAPTPASGVDATCFDCEPDDILTTSTSGSNTVIDFDTLTSTGLDGVEFTTAPGASVEINLQINGIYQNDLVFLPSNGQTTIPTCMPLVLAPSSP